MLPTEKLVAIERRFQEVEQLLCDPEILRDSQELSRLNKERSDIEPVVRAYGRLKAVEEAIEEDKAALEDPELKELAEMELEEHRSERAELEAEIQLLLLPKDVNDERDTIVEVRAGTGGEEAALFAADIFRMLTRYAEKKRWKVEILSTSEASAGGYKEVVAAVKGDHVYSHLRHEAGVHRVQRVPSTETQGRVHTSTATVAVLPEADEVDVHIDPKDLATSFAAAGGPGGQGVNTTNSAIRLKHKPSGIMVHCQEERSAHKNEARAMMILRSKLLEIEQRKQQEELTAERRGMVGSGERSEKIRTYNFPQSRVTDHRINLTLHSLPQVMQGDLDAIVDALRAHRQAELLRLQAEDT
ncbi:MAG: peptide chain release factor 1 [Myxococcota bacterium]